MISAQGVPYVPAGNFFVWVPGMTTERAFVLGDDTVYREWGYVAMSRGREENRLYAVASQATTETDQPFCGHGPAAVPAMQEPGEILFSAAIIGGVWLAGRYAGGRQRRAVTTLTGQTYNATIGTAQQNRRAALIDKPESLICPLHRKPLPDYLAHEPLHLTPRVLFDTRTGSASGPLFRIVPPVKTPKDRFAQLRRLRPARAHRCRNRHVGIEAVAVRPAHRGSIL